MFTRRNWILVIIALVSLCSISNAQMCGKIKAVSCGENHTLAIADDNSLLSCGSGNYILGQGPDVYQSSTLKKVKGINGSGSLQSVSCFDAGWEHGLAVANNILVSWGPGTLGQLGNGGNDPCQFPTKVHGVLGKYSSHHKMRCKNTL